MARHLLRESVLIHIALAIAVVVTSAVLAAGLLDGGFEMAPVSPAHADQAAEAAPLPTKTEAAALLPARDVPMASRGGRSAVSPGPDLVAGDSYEPARPPAATAVPTSPPASVAALIASPPDSAAVRMPPSPSAVATIAPATAVAEPSSAPPPTSPEGGPTTAALALPDLSGLRVGIQAGHWKNSELPAELASLRGSTGAVGSGWKEVDVNLDVATRVVAILKGAGVQVDLLPATVPVAYKANAFVAIHGDANSNPSASGYKLARARWSRIPQKDDSLLQAIAAEYRSATGLRDHPSSITENMRQYYAFDFPDLQHAVASTTPSVILELGFLTTASDRKLLLEQPDKAAQGVARGIIRFLTGR